ncbi:T9SS type A sorting domain-containing protein [bacterium]|nr:T9SS type A sorting domain-containing protein [bacterium]
MKINQIRIFGLFLALISILLPFHFSYAQDSLNISSIGNLFHIMGFSGDIDAQNDRFLVASPNTGVIEFEVNLEENTPVSYQILDRFEATHAGYIGDSLIYAVSWDSLIIFADEDQDQMRRVFSSGLTHADQHTFQYYTVGVSENILILSDGVVGTFYETFWTQIFDLSNLEDVEYTTNFIGILDFRVAGDRIYYTQAGQMYWGNGLQSVELDSFRYSGNEEMETIDFGVEAVNNIHLQNSRLYGFRNNAHAEDQILQFDITNPLEPVLMTSIDISLDFPAILSATRDTLLASDRTKILLLELSEENEPVLIDSVETISPENFGRATLNDGIMCSKRYYEGISFWENNVNGLSEIPYSLPDKGSIKDMYVLEDMVYVSMLDGGLRILDLNEEPLPSVRDTLDIRPFKCTVAREYLYTMSSEGEVSKFSLQTRFQPVPAGSITLQGQHYYDIQAWDEGRVIVTGQHDGFNTLYLVDMNDPNYPDIATGELNYPLISCTNPPYLYASGKIFEVDNNADVELVDQGGALVIDLQYGIGLGLSGDGEYSHRIVRYDYSDPLHPVVVGRYHQIDGEINALSILNANYMGYESQRRIHLYDISNSDTLIEVGYYPVDYSIIAMFMDNESRLFVNRGDEILVLDVSGATPVREKTGDYPSKIETISAYPNPFNSTCEIRFELTQTKLITLKLYDILGREVINLFDGKITRGIHTHSIDGSELASGIYFVSMEGENFEARQKILLLK